MAKYKNKIAPYCNTTVKKQNFKEEDLVLKKIMQNTKDLTIKALNPTWEGSYQVIKVVGPETYTLANH